MKKILAIILLVLSLGLVFSFASNIDNLSNYFNNSNNTNNSTDNNSVVVNPSKNDEPGNHEEPDNNEEPGNNEEPVTMDQHNIHLEDFQVLYAHPKQLASGYNVECCSESLEFDFTFYSTSNVAINSYNTLMDYCYMYSLDNNHSNISFVGDGTFVCDYTSNYFNNTLYGDIDEGEYSVDHIIYSSTSNRIYINLGNDKVYNLAHSNKTTDYSGSLSSISPYDEMYVIYSFNISDTVSLAS